MGSRWGQVFTFDIPCKQAMKGRLAPNTLGVDLCRLLHDRQFLRYEFVAYGPPVIPEITDDHLDRVSPRVDDLMVAIRRNIPTASSPELMRFHCAGIPPQLGKVGTHPMVK